ncbi:MAG TPA: FtsQ-type POTRA domain-containing protein [Candidatus Dormibacteraeota bacterium]|nr:FtsQ-type POTRA domain-containing protein [Candidatus Dormibacteraeota bacterium]
MSATAIRPRKRSAGQARRTTPAVRRRVGGGRLPRGRILALLLLATLLGGGAALVNGPWLRVEQVVHAGQRYTQVATLDEILEVYRGDALLAIDRSAIAERVRGLPAVAGVQVEALLPDQLRVTIAEKEPAFSWITSAARLLGAADGTLISELARDAELPPDLAGLPVVDDERRRSRNLIVGDVIHAEELHIAQRLLDLDPALLGSASTGTSLRIDAEHGFILVSTQPAWQAAFGFYGLDPGGDAVALDARLDEQVAAIRTLFATRPETSVRWVDARNPEKVYWAP